MDNRSQTNRHRNFLLSFYGLSHGFLTKFFRAFFRASCDQHCDCFDRYEHDYRHGDCYLFRHRDRRHDFHHGYWFCRHENIL
jgi:hypothetical protein